MAKTVIGTFDDVGNAQRAVDALLTTGVHRSKVAIKEDPMVVARPRSGKPRRRNASALAVGLGVVLGGYWGHAVGVAVGLYGMATQSWGGVSIEGLLGLIVVGAGIGAGIGGVIGTIAGLDVFPEDSREPAEGTKRMGAVVTVDVLDDVAETTSEFLIERGAIDVTSRDAVAQRSARKPRDVTEST